MRHPYAVSAPPPLEEGFDIKIQKWAWLFRFPLTQGGFRLSERSGLTTDFHVDGHDVLACVEFHTTPQTVQDIHILV